MKITRKSQITGEVHTLDLPITEEQIARYEAGALVQVAFPDLDKALREFIMSGITPEEWQQHVVPPPDEEDNKGEPTIQTFVFDEDGVHEIGNLTPEQLHNTIKKATGE